MIGTRMKALFFDAPAVVRSVDAATRRVLSRFGAFVRSSARQSMRRRKAASPPGSPPSVHKGQIKKFLWFAYDPARRSVVIGPEALPGGKAIAPEVLEYGGTERIKTGTTKRRKTVTARYAARPFMGPALAKERPKLPGLWANSVKPA